MNIKQQFRVLGCKGFKGNVEGTDYDSTKLYVEMPVSEKNGTEVGCNASVVPFGKSDEFHKLKGLPFPLQAELEIVMTTKGVECVGFRALPAKAS